MTQNTDTTGTATDIGQRVRVTETGQTGYVIAANPVMGIITIPVKGGTYTVHVSEVEPIDD